MKRFLIIIAIVIGIGFAGIAKAEEINKFDVQVYVNKDASVNISENIKYNFDGNEKHGIFRDIPVRYVARGGNFSIKITDISVADENGNPYIYKISYPGNNLEIKIGDPNQLVTGVKTYVINYKVDRAINYFSDHDEFYWNVTGNDWQVPIEKTDVEVGFGDAYADSSYLKFACYAGAVGSQNPCSGVGTAADGQVGRFAQDLLAPSQGLTIVFGWPKGAVAQPNQLQSILTVLQDNPVVFLPICVFILLFLYWLKYGRDPKGRGTIIPQYDVPDNLSPAEVGTIIDSKAQNKDLSAEIIDLAIKGYLKITRTETGIFNEAGYTFTKLKDLPDAGNAVDKKLMDSIFKSGSTVNLSDLKTKVYKDFRGAINMVYKSVVEKGYFTRNPNAVRSVFLVIGFVFALLSIRDADRLGWITAVSFIAASATICIFGFVMPQKTKKGAETKEYIQGLKLYLTVAEKDRINFHNAPEKNPETFEKFLPYAMALGVEKEWAKQFEDIYTQNPSWYNDPTGARFSAVILASHMSSFSHTAGTAMATAPGKSSGFGGGGSGGGFGGGGGGSW